MAYRMPRTQLCPYCGEPLPLSRCEIELHMKQHRRKSRLSRWTAQEGS